MPESRTSPSWAERTPVLLTTLRALLSPVVVLLSLYAPLPDAFAACLVLAFLSDIFDGVLARRLGVATANLRRLDSAADTLFYAACAFAAWHLYPSAITERWVPLVVLAALEVARYAVDFLKFQREASYHMWSSKAWGAALFVSQGPLDGCGLDQMSRTWRSNGKPTRQEWPSPVSTVAVRWLMRTTIPTWVFRYLSSNETFSPQRKSPRPGLS